MKTQTVSALLAMVLVSCASVSTGTPIPTATTTPILPTPTSTAEGMFITVIPTPLPTQPTIAVITPDPIQVERWKEYQTELAKSLLSFLPPETVLCEWEILGRSNQEVYMWAVCDSNTGKHGADTAVVVHLDENGAVQNVERPGSGSQRIPNMLRMFPPDIYLIITNNLMNYHQLTVHLDWRIEHPDVPPLVILSANQMP